MAETPGDFERPEVEQPAEELRRVEGMREVEEMPAVRDEPGKGGPWGNIAFAGGPW
jgi:hypothetical protein